MESNKRVGIAISACIAAAATGVIVVAAFVKWRSHEADGRKLENSLRDVQDVLSDCYDKIHEIENHLPSSQSFEVAPQQEPGFILQSNSQSSKRSMSN